MATKNSKHIHIHLGTKDAKVKDASHQGPLRALIAALDADFKKTDDTSYYEDCIDAIAAALRKAENS